MVVGGNTQVGIQLWTKTIKKERETEIERERETGNWWLARRTAGESTCVCVCLGHKKEY